MKKLCLFAAVAGLTLVSASPPGTYGSAGARTAPGPYPPCSRTVRDSCTNRGVREPESRALDAMPDSVSARGGPYEAPPPYVTNDRVYPPCSARLRDSCDQSRTRHARYHRYAHRVRHLGDRG